MLKLNRAASWMLVLAAGVAFQHPAWAQPERPIIIHGGSLEVRYEGGWRHINPVTVGYHSYDSRVTKVQVSVNDGAPQVIAFDHQQCEIRVKVGTIGLAVQTDPNGQNLRVTAFGGPRFGKELALVKKPKGFYQSRSKEPLVGFAILKDGVPVGPEAGTDLKKVDIIIDGELAPKR